jgi:hypothetical protein
VAQNQQKKSAKSAIHQLKLMRIYEQTAQLSHTPATPGTEDQMKH